MELDGLSGCDGGVRAKSDMWFLCIIVYSYVSMAPGVDNFSVLRTFRILRPLRTLSTIPGTVAVGDLTGTWT